MAGQRNRRKSEADTRRCPMAALPRAAHSSCHAAKISPSSAGKALRGQTGGWVAPKSPRDGPVSVPDLSPRPSWCPPPCPSQAWRLSLFLSPDLSPCPSPCPSWCQDPFPCPSPSLSLGLPAGGCPRALSRAHAVAQALSRPLPLTRRTWRCAGRSPRRPAAGCSGCRRGRGRRIYWDRPRSYRPRCRAGPGPHLGTGGQLVRDWPATTTGTAVTSPQGCAGGVPQPEMPHNIPPMPCTP